MVNNNAKRECKMEKENRKRKWKWKSARTVRIFKIADTWGPA